MKKSIAFDLDGTLIDISKRDYAIYKDILIENGYCYLTFNEYWKLRQSKYNIFELLSLTGVDKGFYDVYLRLRDERMEDNKYLKLDKLFDDTVHTLKSLQTKYNIILVTKRNNTENTINQIKCFGLYDCFSELYITDNCKIEIFIKQKLLFAVIGDTENDILPANSLNVISIGVLTGIRNYKQLLQYNPTYIIKRLGDVVSLLLNQC